jgi:hypothetical protein
VKLTKFAYTFAGSEDDDVFDENAVREKATFNSELFFYVLGRDSPMLKNYS